MSRLALFLLGPPRIERDGVLVDVDTRKAIALLAYLAITRQQQSRDTLATLLWPEYDQTHARATLRRTLSVLNKALWWCTSLLLFLLLRLWVEEDEPRAQAYQ